MFERVSKKDLHMVMVSALDQPPPPPAKKKRQPIFADFSDLFCRFVGFLDFANLFCHVVWVSGASDKKKR